MTNRDVFDAFARDEQLSGALNVSSRQYANLTVLYSYDTPIAYRENGGRAVFDEHAYSVTTGKQRHDARAACQRHGVEIDSRGHVAFVEKLAAKHVPLGRAA